jgi:hypothetical protein
MKINVKVAVSGLFFLIISGNIFAGNNDRVGQAGASELLINPWSRTTGWAGSNASNVRGLEASFLNIAGLAYTQRTEVILARTQWLKGSDINVNGFGLSQKVGKEGMGGVLALSFMSFNPGEIPITTTEQPEGGLGTFKPEYSNISLGYAKEFSNSIFGGFNVKAISERGASNIKSQGVAFDAGIQYHTNIVNRKDTNRTDAERNRKTVHFGIALKNVGAPMSYTGDGLSVKATLPTGTVSTVEQRATKFELPSLLSISGSYDYYVNKSNDDYRISLAGSFVANSFQKNQFLLGLELAWKNMFMLRGGYVIERKSATGVSITNLLAGPTAGVSFEPKLAKEKASTVAIDYAYRSTKTFGGCHTIGLRLNL